MTTSRATINGITGYIQNGTAYLRLADLAVCMGFSQQSPDGSLQPNWEALSPILERLGLSSSLCSEDSFVPVSIFHCLAEEIGTLVAQRFQAYVDRSVIPTLQSAATSPDVEGPDLPAREMEQQPTDHDQLDESKEHPQELQPEGEKSGESNWQNDEVFIPGDRDHKKQVGIALAILAILIIAVAIGIDAVQKHKADQKNAESISEVTVSAFDAKETESNSQTKKSTSSSNIVSDFDKLSLVIAAEDAIKKELVSPNSAKFPVYSQWDVEKIGDTYYSVSSYVDAKNRLGVELRQDVNVLIDYNGLSYSILFVTIDDDVYFGS